MDENQLEIFKEKSYKMLENIASKITEEELKFLNSIVICLNDVCYKHTKLECNWDKLKMWIDSLCFYDDDTITYEQISNEIAQLEEDDDDLD